MGPISSVQSVCQSSYIIKSKEADTSEESVSSVTSVTLNEKATGGNSCQIGRTCNFE